MEEERPKVKSIDKMDNETFLMHMNSRHKGAAGLQKFGKSNVPGDTDEHLLRAMHRCLHDPRNEHMYHPNHNHGKARE